MEARSHLVGGRDATQARGFVPNQGLNSYQLDKHWNQMSRECLGHHRKGSPGKGNAYPRMQAWTRGLAWRAAKTWGHLSLSLSLYIYIYICVYVYVYIYIYIYIYTCLFPLPEWKEGDRRRGVWHSRVHLLKMNTEICVVFLPPFSKSPPFRLGDSLNLGTGCWESGGLFWERAGFWGLGGNGHPIYRLWADKLGHPVASLSTLGW